jgi:hypothetical protein
LTAISALASQQAMATEDNNVKLLQLINHCAGQIYNSKFVQRIQMRQCELWISLPFLDNYRGFTLCVNNPTMELLVGILPWN